MTSKFLLLTATIEPFVARLAHATVRRYVAAPPTDSTVDVGAPDAESLLIFFSMLLATRMPTHLALVAANETQSSLFHWRRPPVSRLSSERAPSSGERRSVASTPYPLRASYRGIGERAATRSHVVAARADCSTSIKPL
jgi:hypothetical protein